MEEVSKNVSDRSLMEKALLEIRRLRKELEVAARGRRQPIAIVGLGCRLPGGIRDAESYWQVLRDGVDAVTEIPPDRLDLANFFDPEPGAAGKTYCRHGAFLDNIDLFDPAFFGISPRDAEGLDPQQRLLLEVAWEALEDAALEPRALAGSSTGVFTGLFMDDYSRLGFASGDPARVDAYNCLGSLRSLAAGRLSYTLGLRGPSIQLDTACSSSLVAVHLACLHLQTAQCDLALAGGANLILSPESTLGVSQLRGLSTQGRCRTFDAGADGYVRGEGCALVVLKRLDEALAHGDPIHAVIRGSAINHDGRSNGLTAPSGSAQEAVIRSALEEAQVRPEEIPYVEAHGTGTWLGDPIEAVALGNVLGPGRGPENPLWMGASKTNFGHLEAAAGTASLIKAVLAVTQRHIPPNLHFTTPNPHIPWASLPLAVPTELTPWPADQRRIAGVSSFGMSGTNAHVIVEEAPTSTPLPEDTGPQLFCLSARSMEELRTLARRHGEFLQGNPSLPLARVCATAALGRQAFPHRLAVVASTLDQLTERLLGEDLASCTIATAGTNNKTKVAFLFTGQGSPPEDWGKSVLLEGEEFRKAIDRCSELFEPHLGTSLAERFFSPTSDRVTSGRATSETTFSNTPLPNQPTLASLTLAQPALFTLQVALTEQWRAWGVEPAVVLGYSFGEISAAWAAGILSLEQAVAMVAQRSLLVAQLGGRGAMAVVELGGPKLQDVLDSLVMANTSQGPGVEVAALLGPTQTVVSGSVDEVHRLSEQCRALGVKTRHISVSQAFHSSHLDPVLEPFGKALKGLAFSPSRIPLISNLNGQIAASETAKPEYWLRQLRETIQWSPCLDTLGEHLSGEGPALLLEIGSQPVLLGLAARHPATTSLERLPSLRPRRDARTQMLGSLGRYWAAGGAVRWEHVFGPAPQRLHLPTYPFERRRFWLAPPSHKPSSAVQRRPGPSVAQSEPSLLGRRLPLPGLKEIVFETPYSLEHQPILGHHRLRGEVVVAAACWISSLLAAASDLGWKSCVLEDLLFPQPLSLSSQEERIVHLVLQPVQGASHPRWSFEILSFSPQDSDATMLHASGHMAPHEGAAPAPFDPKEIEARLRRQGRQHLTGQGHYSHQEAAQLSLGPLFRWLAEAWCGSAESLVRLEPPAEASTLEVDSLRAGWIDGCFQALATVLAAEQEGAEGESAGDTIGETTAVPFRLRRLVMNPLQEETQPLWCHASRNQGQPREEGSREQPPQGQASQGSQEPPPRRGDLRLVDAAGRAHLQLEGLEVRTVPSPGRPTAELGSPDEALHGISWRPAPPPSAPTHPREGNGVIWIVSNEDDSPNPTLLALLEACSKNSTCEVLTLEELSSRSAKDMAGRPAKEVGDRPSSIFFLARKEAVEEPLRPPPETALQSACELLELVQILSRNRFTPPPQLTVVTHNAQSVGIAQENIDPAQSALWGLAAVVDREHPELACRCLDLDWIDWNAANGNSQKPDRQDSDRQDSARSLNGLSEALSAPVEENRLALRQGQMYLARLTQSPTREKTTREAKDQPWLPSRDGTLLITGGLGGVGLEVAGWWVEQGGRHLLLTGRREEPTSRESAALEELRQDGATVLYRSCDVSNRQSLAALWADLPNALPPIDAVVHAAGVVDDGLLEHQNPDRFRGVFSSKALGAWNIHLQTLDQPLSLFLCCSSAASLLGTPGQAGYAAANAFLDGLCHLRRLQGQAALSLNWGPWKGRGMAGRSKAAARDLWQAAGVSSLSPATALAPLPRLLKQGVAQALVMRANWETFSRQAQAERTSRRASRQNGGPVPREGFLSELTQLRSPQVSLQQVSSQQLSSPRLSSPPMEDHLRSSSRVRQQLNKLPPREGRRLLAASLRSTLEEVSGLGSPHPVAGSENLFELGLDSLMAVDLRSRLEDQLGVLLPTTFVFDNPTLVAIERELSRELFPAKQPSSLSSSPQGEKAPARVSKQIASIEHLREEEAEALLLEQLQRLDS
ncbi:MAG: SDR family NAD(P)-dependent oxidoreductase [Deltaproteobacteria bacterium]|nr:SDR family NAD(P)-dependent oxidoreductase [Deltaproteobacteria bacterium]